MNDVTNAPFDVCTACRRHIKARESRCPFCDAKNAHVASEHRVPRRMSRAAWAAIGSTLAVSGCSSSASAPDEPEETGALVDASSADAFPAIDTAWRDVHSDMASLDRFDGFDGARADIGYCPVADIYAFTCSGLACHCSGHGGGPWTCEAEGVDASVDETTKTCFTCLRCTCPFPLSDSCVPVEGGTEVDSIFSHACYGSPPMRLV